MPAANKPPADLSPTEMKALVAYLQSLSGEITVVITAEDVAAAEARKTKKPAPASSHPGFALLGAKGCVACHDFSGSTRMVGPPLTHVGERLSAAEIRQSIVDPNAVIAEGYQKDLMLQDFAATLTPNELDQLVSYLSGDVPLSARLAHPGVHLLMLILLFNGGVAWAARRVESMGDVPPPGTAPKRGPLLGRIGAIGVAFGVVAAVYSGIRYQENRRLAARAESTPAATAASEIAVDTTTELGLEGATATAMDGEALYKVTCPACHGQQAEGVPGLGKDITKSEFVMGLSDAELVEFIKQGRAANDPLNTTGVEMPPKGLNAALSDEEILAIVHFIRALGR
jgi:disulfide bond formation protein DsbB